VSKPPTDRLGQAYYIPFANEERRTSKGYDQVYAAVSQVIKATIFTMMQLRKGITSIIPRALLVYYPVVVFDGKMFQYTLSSTGNLR